MRSTRCRVYTSISNWKVQKLIDRAHELIDADLTHLSEDDDVTDELRVRATKGAVSEHMRGLRVQAGIGLASQIVRNRSA